MPTIKFIGERNGFAKIEVDGEPFNITIFKAGDEIDPDHNVAVKDETAAEAVTRWSQAAYGGTATMAADPDEALAAAIEAATDFASLKAALLGSRGAGKVKGRSV